MSARATWKGVLKISLVTIPIKVFPATESTGSIAFNQLHETCQSRVSQKRWCATCDREVPSAEIVKGYEFEKGRYVLLLDAELDAVQPPSTRVIDLTQFAEASALDPVSIDRSYYLAPDGGPAADQAFAVMSAALCGKVGIGKLAIYGREYLVAVRPPSPMQHMQIGALFLHTLHHAAEVRAIPDSVPTFARVPPDQAKLARQVIAACTGPLNLADYTDAYRVELQRLIDAKIAGEEIVVAPVLEQPAVLNLREALLQSLDAVSATKQPPLKIAATRQGVGHGKTPAAVARRKRAS